MNLPDILGDLNIKDNSFFVGCDSEYFDTYGKSLINSLKEFASWAHIHAHIFNPTDSQLEWCRRKDITRSFEYIELSTELETAYYSNVRFIRVPEIFDHSTRVISLDCDSIAINVIDQTIFLEFTDISTVLWRSKHRRSLASSVFFGPDDFRIVYAKRILEYFKSDTAEWYLDQNIMDEMVFGNEVNTTDSNIWGSPKVKDNILIWTGKGDIKNTNQEFEKLRKIYETK